MAESTPAGAQYSKCPCYRQQCCMSELFRKGSVLSSAAGCSMWGRAKQIMVQMTVMDAGSGCCCSWMEDGI